MESVNAYQLADLLGVAHTTIYTYVGEGMPYETIHKGKTSYKRFNVAECKQWIENKKEAIK